MGEYFHCDDELAYSRVAHAFYATPWALLPEKLVEIESFIRLKVAGGDVDPETIKAVQMSRRPDGVAMVGRVAVLPVFGVLAQRIGMIEAMSGGVSTEGIERRLEGLVADRQVKAIVMAFDSPGGSVYGIEELGRKIRSLRDEKKIVGIADSIAASAAYWLLSQTSEVNVTPGGQVGSIGVIVAHTDRTQFDPEAKATTLVTSSPHKAEGADLIPLSEDARSELQAKVNHYHGMFVGAVAKGRGVTAARVEKDFGRGRMVTAQAAVDRGMADRVATLEQVLKSLGALEGEQPAGARAAIAARARSVEIG